MPRSFQPIRRRRLLTQKDIILMRLRSQHRRVGLTAGLLALGLASALTPSASAQTPTIFQNFTGTTFHQMGDGVPPDTMGAMGINNQFGEFINGSFANFDTSAGSLVSRVTDQQFWQSAGVSVSGLSDPRLLFDTSSQRWFATEITTASTNAFLVAVSNSADLAQGFKGYTFQANPSTGSQGLFADYDMLGVNGDGVYLAANNFTNPTPTGSDNSSSILSLSKADLISENAAPASHLFYAIDPNSTGYLPHPVTDLDTPQASGKEYFLSAYTQNAAALSSLTGSGSNPGGQVLSASGGNVVIASNPEPGNASQAGSAGVINTDDSRFGSAVIKRNGFLWSVQEAQQNGHVALHWEQTDPTSGKVVHEGFIGDSAHDYYYGSIAVNAANAIVIGYTRSGPTEDPSSYASVGQLNATGVTFNSPLLLKLSTTPYNGFDGSPYRWGDYSNTVVDPTDSSKFWTVQEFSASDGTYATQITGIEVSAAPEPSQLAGLGFTAFGVLGLILRARRRKAAAPSA